MSDEQWQMRGTFTGTLNFLFSRGCFAAFRARPALQLLLLLLMPPLESLLLLLPFRRSKQQCHKDDSDCAETLSDRRLLAAAAPPSHLLLASRGSGGGPFPNQTIRRRGKRFSGVSLPCGRTNDLGFVVCALYSRHGNRFSQETSYGKLVNKVVDPIPRGECQSKAQILINYDFHTRID